MAYEAKTRKTGASVDEFLAAVEPEARRADCEKLRAMMRAATGEDGAMWGPSIVGFGRYSYRYASGHSGESFLTGFSPRKPNFSIYLMPGFERYEGLLAKLRQLPPQRLPIRGIFVPQVLLFVAERPVQSAGLESRFRRQLEKRSLCHQSLHDLRVLPHGFDPLKRFRLTPAASLRARHAPCSDWT